MKCKMGEVRNCELFEASSELLIYLYFNYKIGLYIIYIDKIYFLFFFIYIYIKTVYFLRDDCTESPDDFSYVSEPSVTQLRFLFCVTNV